jgi:hypothetical protein
MSAQSHGMMLDTPEEVPTCRRCHRPVVREAENFETFERMHWSCCFHYEFEHQAAGSADDDHDVACMDPACPARAFDREAQLDWLAGN